MSTNKKYLGKTLNFEYPSFLKIKSEEPQWSAVGPKGQSSMYVLIDPPRAVADACRAAITNPRFQNAPGLIVEVIREGDFLSQSGITGCERLSRITNPAMEIFWAWGILGQTGSGQTVVIEMRVANAEWLEGIPWTETVHSIAIN